jgi:Fe-S cluster assembly protein SufD
MEKTNFTRLFDAFDRTASAKYQSLRQAARARLQSLPMPTARTEDWRFTNIVPLLDIPFELPGAAPSIDPAVLPALPTPDTLRLVFVNGCYAKSLSSHASLPSWVQVGPLANPEITPKSLTQIASGPDQVFTALNTSFLHDGAFVAIHAGTTVAQPIEIFYVSQPSSKPIVTNPRTLVLVGDHAQATIVERFFSAGEGVYFTNAVTEMVLAENAIVEHVKVQEEGAQAYHVANTQVIQAGCSNFTTHYLALGGSLVRNEVRIRFDGEHAEATVNGLYLAAGKQHIDNFTVIDHAKPNCASHELYKGILDDQSHGVFNGKILVRKDAQKTDAKQTNKVLLLSDNATINTKPQLEIFADDVKCTHGATVGQLDATQLFYLQSRGIPLDEARRLLTFAFANDIVGRLKIEALRGELEKLIVK